MALTYIDDMLSFQNKIKDKAITTSTYRLKGIMLYLLSMYPEALTSLNTALRMDRSLKVKFGEASDLANIGMVHMTQSHFPEALNYYLQSSKIFETLKEHEYDAITVYANTGIIYLEVNNYEKALEHFNKAIVNSKRLKNANTEASALANIGVVYNKQKNYEKAITYSKMSLKLIKVQSLVSPCLF
jgi:tetratricopeptide (TPR) repeat protein